VSLGLSTQPAAIRSNAQKQRSPGASKFRPFIENLEDRCTPATLGQLELPIDVENVRIVEDQIVADVVFAGQTFEDAITITNATLTPGEGDECAILDLEIGAVNLNLLGLQVETSDICATITAHEGEGLLGDLGGLLCNLDIGLGGALTDVLDNLSGTLTDLTGILGDLESVLDDILGSTMDITGAFGSGGAPADVLAMAHADGDVCDILNLELGPIDLTLLGLQVEVNNCVADDPATEEVEGPGPVTVDITGNPEGGLLGQVLCGLADGIDLGGIVDQIDDLVDSIVDLGDRLADLTDSIEDLTDTIDDLPSLPNLNGITNQLDNLVKQLENAVEQVDSVADLNKLVNVVERVENRVEKLVDKVEKLTDRLGDDLGDVVSVGQLKKAGKK